jgi:hypothetical protein
MSDMKHIYLKKYFQMNSFVSSRQPSAATALRSLHSQISNTVIDYSPWTRQQRRSQKSAGTGTTNTFLGILPRRFFQIHFSNKMKQFSHL